ncbi:HelD family protein [Companilactobacillus ginsenosidimutans]|uniref:UvrD-like helicase ATP-binding domain-containing protein n=1 Tax=Companilactobacillus ginsenosidimutans TaxID=1007676 RepID=A0A0H4QKT2_9LACO|nr:UvrD-helicase domain-containing protein [Companilactobacillus ginsenosidimutans]AKP67323.1 hypothetical protein ABM34_07070 [Companilactobacillus ginsenosidimutans]
MDKTFNAEQTHLTKVYTQLQTTLEQLNTALSKNKDTAVDFKKNSGKRVALNFDSYADNLDTFAAMESMNKEIDAFNTKQSNMEEMKARIIRLLPSAYFARIDLLYPDEQASIPFYIGPAGFSPDADNPVVLDWRSPLADLYYNNRLGETSYSANNMDIPVTVDKRRQFLVHEDVLENVFDSDVAIQDPLLVKTLQQNKGNQMSSITATIQREQNVIIRDTSSQALLVNGIAGSGKTSVVLQRIAYLLYRYRENLISEDVLLLTPNKLFTNYINRVLPSLGETSPQQMTFSQLLDQFIDIDIAFDEPSSHLSKLSEKLPNFELSKNDFRNLKLNGNMIFSKTRIKSLFDQTPKTMTLQKRITALTSVLEEKINQGIAKASTSKQAQSDLTALSDAQQEKIFGKLITPNSDEETQRATKKMLEFKYRKVLKVINLKKWVNISNILQEMLESDQLNKLDYAFTRLITLDLARKNLRFVMIDEIQDYTLEQIYFLIKAFPKAQWTLVGDEFQSITDVEHPLTFDGLKNLFEENNVSVTQRNLFTSYRSSGEITAQFVKYGSAKLPELIHTVQEGGEKPVFAEAKTIEELAGNISQQISDLSSDELSAIITDSDSEAQDIIGQVGLDTLVLPSKKEKLPDSGVVVLPLSLAKGLEFDNVIVTNVNSEYYRGNFGNNRLYTAFSRGSKRLFVNSLGEA